ncbi:MAG TPA: hypothetical protein VI318_22230 [Baekduia sp.]
MHAQGLFPYRDFPFEYPPGALISVWLVGGDDVRLSELMLACAIVAQLGAWAIGGARAGWLMVLLPVVAGALVRLHFDLLPAALCLVGLALVVRRPWRRGGVELGLAVLALGAMTKLWPGAVAVVALVWLAGRGERRLALRSGAIFVAVCLAIGAPFAVAGGFPGPMISYHLDRPVQIESSAASVIEVVGGSYVTGDPIRHDAFKSNGLDGGAADAIGHASTVLMLAAFLLILWLIARRPTEDALVAAALAITLAFVALGTVLSPQYLCWLLPLAAAAVGRRVFLAPALIAGAALLTQRWFPRRYFDLVFQHYTEIAEVAIRNALLLAALAALLRTLWRMPAAPALRPAAPGATAPAPARSPSPAAVAPSSG